MYVTEVRAIASIIYVCVGGHLYTPNLWANCHYKNQFSGTYIIIAIASWYLHENNRPPGGPYKWGEPTLY